jgi:hypothetical protein
MKAKTQGCNQTLALWNWVPREQTASVAALCDNQRVHHTAVIALHGSKRVFGHDGEDYRDPV